MKIYIKNMVARGTRKFVLSELKKLGLKIISFESGELEFQDDLSPEKSAALEKSLGKYGLELISGETNPELQYALYSQDNSFAFDDMAAMEDMMEMAEMDRSN